MIELDMEAHEASLHGHSHAYGASVSTPFDPAERHSHDHPHGYTAAHRFSHDHEHTHAKKGK